MSKLTLVDNELHLALSGATDFRAALDMAKAIYPRQFDPETKNWKYPKDPGTAERLLRTIKPSADSSLLAWVKNSRAEREQELTTQLPDDASAPLYIPWSDKMYDYQRSFVEFAQDHPKLILADDLGLGKTLQALSAVTEWLLRCSDEKAAAVLGLGQEESRPTSGAHQGVRQEVPRKDSSDNSGREERAMRGLPGDTAAGTNGLGSRSRREGNELRAVDENQGSYGHDSNAGGSSRDSEVRSALPELSPTTTLASRPRLIICPASVQGVWNREITKWLGTDAPRQLVDGKTPKKRAQQLERGIADGAWCIVNWEQLRVQKHTETKIVNHRDGTVSEQEHVTWKLKQPLFGDTAWLAVIADEAHRAKNRKAAQTRGLWEVKAPVMLALTGTPLANSPDELWSLLHWLYPEQYGRSTPGHPRTAFWPFHDQYTDFYDGYGNSKIVIGVKNPDGLRFELKDRLVRRTKAQKLNLPAKTREYIPLTMGTEQAKIYQEAETDFWLTIDQQIKAGDNNAKRFAEEVLSGQKKIYEISNGASRMVRLRQVLCSPALLGGKDVSVKMDAVMETILDNSHQQHVVFTEFVEGANIMVARLKARGVEAEAFTGEVTDMAIRTYFEDRFQNEKIDVLVGTIGAMREGITLTSASTVHFIERSWVPANNEQAEDRLHRIGQTNPVTILIYQVDGTVDTEKVQPTNEMKEMLVSNVITKDKIEVVT